VAQVRLLGRVEKPTANSRAQASSGPTIPAPLKIVCAFDPNSASIDQPAVARGLQLDPHHSRQVTPHPSRQLEPDGPGGENEEQTTQLVPQGPGDETEEHTKSQILEFVAERKARRKRVERSRGIGL
jgi:hypothetical protein